MQYYKAYPLKASGKIAGPPYEILAENDEQARQAAYVADDPRALEIWSGPRCLGHVVCEEPRALEDAN